MKKLRRLIKRHPRRTEFLAAAMLAIILAALLLVVLGCRLPGKIWLPDNTRQRSDIEALFDLPTTSDTVITKYGRAIRYTSTDGWESIYQFRPSPLLRASACPNITNTESMLPSPCERSGEFQGKPVYSIGRSLPSGTIEYFVQLDGTFLYVKSRGDGGQSLEYLQSFISMSRSQASPYLEANKKRVDEIQAKQAAEKATTDDLNSLAYTKLDFTPALPSSLPAGWQLNTVSKPPIEIDGPDANHPNMVNLNYTDRKGQFVTMHAGRLSDFRLDASCGPSPGYSMGYLVCHKVGNYYEAVLYDDRNDFVRYLYYPVGDSLVISHISVISTDGKQPVVPTELTKIQEAITLGAQPVDKSTLKGSSYHKLYYYSAASP